MPRLRDGFSTTVDFQDFGSAAPGLEIFETTVTPGGIDGGGPNDTTTMRNLKLRTRQPKKLRTLTSGTFTAAYDPKFFETIVTMVNKNQIITVNFPDGSTYSFFGWLDKFIPNEIVEGEQPTAEVTFEPSNADNSSPPIEHEPGFNQPPFPAS